MKTKFHDANGATDSRHGPSSSQPPDIPDMSVLRTEIAPAPPFDAAILGPLSNWAQDAAKSKGCPVDYVSISIVAAVGAATGTARAVSPWGDGMGWEEHPIIHALLIGSPSAGKSPGMDAVVGSLHEIEREISADWDESLKQHNEARELAKAAREHWEKLVKTALDKGHATPPKPDNAHEPAAPIMPRLVVGSVTVEVAGRILAGNERGLIMVHDEAAQWLSNLERYGGDDRAFYLKAYGGRADTTDRVKDNGVPIRLKRCAMGIIGAIQPGRFSDLVLDTTDDGLAARSLFAWPDPVTPTRPTTPFCNYKLTNTLRRLRNLPFAQDAKGDTAPVVMPLTVEAAGRFEAWRQRHHREAIQLPTGLMASAYGKMQGQVLRIALICELLWWAAGPDGRAAPTDVDAGALDAAIQFIEAYHKPMLARVLGDAAVPMADRHAAALAREIVKRGAAVINARIVRREWRIPGLRDAAAVSAATNALVEAGWLRPVPTRDGDTPGRTKADYAVDPRVHGAVS